jgi:hypothetical protein
MSQLQCPLFFLLLDRCGGLGLAVAHPIGLNPFGDVVGPNLLHAMLQTWLARMVHHLASKDGNKMDAHDKLVGSHVQNNN